MLEFESVKNWHFRKTNFCYVNQVEIMNIDILECKYVEINEATNWMPKSMRQSNQNNTFTI